MDMSVSGGRQPDGGGVRYVVIASLQRGEVEVKTCDSMTEAILHQFDVERTIVWAGFTCPPMRVEMRGAQWTEKTRAA